MKTLVIALHKNGHLNPVTFELITAATSLGGELVTALVADNPDSMASELVGRGAGTVLTITHPTPAAFNEEIYANVLGEIIDRYAPNVVLGPASFYGKALFGRLAALKGGTMASEVTGLAVEGESITVTRPSYGGSVVARVTASGTPFFITVRPKIFAEAKDGAGSVVAETVSDSCFESKAVVREVKSEASGVTNLAEADIIVSAGRGIRGEENVGLVKDLAVSLGAAFGASRAIVDAGWTEYSNQVGQTGRTVNPKLYVAVGISGAIQHIVGMRSSQQIVAINKDKDAPIFNVATYGIVGDLFEIVPALTKKFKAELGT